MAAACEPGRPRTTPPRDHLPRDRWHRDAVLDRREAVRELGREMNPYLDSWIRGRSRFGPRVMIYRDASDWPTPIQTACVRILSRAWARRPFSGARCACHTLLPRQTTVPACGDGLTDPQAPS